MDYYFSKYNALAGSYVFNSKKIIKAQIVCKF